MRALSPQPNIVHDVATTFGNVRTYQHGQGRGVPVVLIHGFFLTSGMWWEQIEDLTTDFTVYAMDMLGQPGASVQTKPLSTAADCARCIDEALEALGLSSVHLVGHSYGGWLATQTAARAPNRLSTLTLIDPAGTVAALSARFWWSLALLGRPESARAQRAAAWITGHHALADLMVRGFAEFTPPVRAATPRLINDAVLQAIQLPVQVLMAGNTVHDSRKGLQRIRSAVPHWGSHFWPDASHALPAELPDEVNGHLRRFVLQHCQ